MMNSKFISHDFEMSQPPLFQSFLSWMMNSKVNFFVEQSGIFFVSILLIMDDEQ